MFAGKGGEGISRHGLQQAWRKAARTLGTEQFHLHDVRHAGLTLAAQTGAATRELMARAGHRTSAAAMTYQHVAEERTHCSRTRWMPSQAVRSQRLVARGGAAALRGAASGGVENPT